MQNKLPLINSAHGSETRNIINEIIKAVNDRGIEILSESGFLTWLEKNGIKHREEVATSADLPANDSLNTVRGVTDDNKIYIKKENGWVPFQTIDISKINEVERIAINRIEELAITPMQFGAIGDGVSDDTQALKDALSFCEENNYLLDFLEKDYRITSTINISCNVRGSRSRIISDNVVGTSVIVGIQDTGKFLSELNSYIPAVINKVKDWTNNIGVEVYNLDHSNINFSKVYGFGKGVVLTGVGQGNAYNTYTFNWLDDNKINLVFDPKENAWTNENNIFILRSSHRGGNGTNIPGVKHVLFTHTGTYQPNNNTLYKPSIEGNVAEIAIDFEGAGHNAVITPRFDGGNMYVRFGIEGSTKFAQNNVIFYGYGKVDNTRVSESSNSRWNAIYTVNNLRVPGRLDLSNAAGGAEGVINIYPQTQSPITATPERFNVRLNQTGIFLKNAAADIAALTINNQGHINWNQVSLKQYGSSALMVSGGNLMLDKGSWNEPHIQLGGYHIWVDGTGNLRLKSSAPTSAEDGKKLLTE